VRTRICRKCHIEKSIREFRYHQKREGKRHCDCRNCHNETARKRRKGRFLEVKRANLRHKHGITLEDYDSLLKLQNGVCAICNKPPSSNTRKGYLSVDHDHKTNKIRGLLCSLCNNVLGFAGDSIKVLEKSIEYLKKEEINNGKE